MRITGLLQAYCLGLVCCLACSSLSAETSRPPLRLLSWEDYIAPEIIERWLQKTGIRIEQVYYDNEEHRDAIIIGSNPLTIDLVIIDAVTAQLFETTPHLQSLDKSSIKGNVNHGESWQKSCGSKAMPYSWGTLGIAYRSDKIHTPPSSWQDLLTPDENLTGHISLLNDYVDTLAPSLLLRNALVSTDNETLLRETYAQLSKLLPSLLTFEYPISFLQSNRRADELYMAMAYSGDQTTMNEISGDQPRWHYIIPDEGTILWVDCIAIMGNSDQHELAVAFIEFLNQPEIAAINTNWTAVATTNNAAMPLLNPEILSDPTVYPSADTLKKAQRYLPITKENMLRRDRIVNALLNRYEAI
jgi:spermidine/putrescine transport system substrate-binding protein